MSVGRCQQSADAVDKLEIGDGDARASGAVAGRIACPLRSYHRGSSSITITSTASLSTSTTRGRRIACPCGPPIRVSSVAFHPTTAAPISAGNTDLH